MRSNIRSMRQLVFFEVSIDIYVLRWMWLKWLWIVRLIFHLLSYLLLALENETF